MKRMLALLLVFVLFLCGIAVGILGTHLFYVHHLRQPGALADQVLEHHSRRLIRELDLRPDQQAVLAGILADTKVEIAGIRRDAVEKLRVLHHEASGRLEEILDPEQKERLRRYQENEGLAIKQLLGE